MNTVENIKENQSLEQTQMNVVSSNENQKTQNSEEQNASQKKTSVESIQYDPYTAKVKKEFLIIREKVGEKRKADTTTAEGSEKKRIRGAYHNRRSINIQHQGGKKGKEKNEEKPLQEDTLNKISLEVQKKLSKKKYNFEKAKEVTKHINTYLQKKNELQNMSPYLRTKEKELAAAYVETKFKPKEIKKVDFKNKTILAPLTTVGNLPFRRICKDFGVDITVGEMALGWNILKGKKGELSLLKRHKCEDVFGIQLAGAKPEEMIKMAEFVNNEITCDFVDLNCGCPIKLMCDRGMGCGLLTKKSKLEGIVRGMKEILEVPLTIKTRMGKDTDKPFAHTLYPLLQEWGADALTLHGRSQEQRYTKEADWDYIGKCSKLVNIPVIGNGDIMSWEEANRGFNTCSAIMIGRGALIKPWIFTEIKEQRYWDITSTERFEMLKKFCGYGLDHWGADDHGVATTRRFLLEWLSFLYRYIPHGILEEPQRINLRPPHYFGRDEMETLMASSHVDDWIKISEMLLGPVPDNFKFVPKHKSNSYKVEG